MTGSHPLERMGAKLDEYIEALDRLVKGDEQLLVPEPLSEGELTDLARSLSVDDYDTALGLLVEIEEVMSLIESRMAAIRETMRRTSPPSRRDSATLLDRRV